MFDVGKDPTGRRYYVAHYASGCLEELPWESENFDCIVLLFSRKAMQKVRATLGGEIIRTNTDWVQVCGVDAESFHDFIDKTSVQLGRQRMAGDGSPMTSWHEDANTLRKMIDVARDCFGGSNYVLMLVVGDRNDADEVIQSLVGDLNGDASPSG
jgi:hypothetical protein